MSQDSDFKQNCVKALEHYKKELGRLRTGRASTSLLEGLTVEYYGSQVPLQQLGLVNAPEPRLLTIQVYDAGAIDAIERAIQTSELGLNPMREGSLLRIPIPSLNEERRKDFIKKVHKMGEEAKVGIRSLRRDAIEAIKKKVKDKAMTEDDSKRAQEEVQKITDKFTADIEVAATQKEKEIMEV